MARSLVYRLILVATLAAGRLRFMPDNTRDPVSRATIAPCSKFNDAADRYVMSPVARAYRTVTPKPARSAIGNFFQ